MANPCNLVSKYLIPSFNVVETKSGKISFKLDNVTPGKYVGLTEPINVDGILFIKSSTLWIGAKKLDPPKTKALFSKSFWKYIPARGESPWKSFGVILTKSAEFAFLPFLE